MNGPFLIERATISLSVIFFYERLGYQFVYSFLFYNLSLVFPMDLLDDVLRKYVLLLLRVDDQLDSSQHHEQLGVYRANVLLLLYLMNVIDVQYY